VSNLGFYVTMTFVISAGHLILRVMKSRRLRCAGYVVRMWETRYAYRIVAGKRLWNRILRRSM